jgi:Tol biopolymer transport system component
MFAGRKAFDGANAMTVIAAIASGEPPPIASLQSAHPLLDHIVRRCLEKDRERRWQNIGDVTGELRWLATQPVPAPVAATASRRGLTLWHWLAAMVIVLGVLPLAMLAAVRWLRPEQPAELPALRLELTTQPTDDPSVALSRDGTQLAFIANRDRQPMLWIRPLDGSSDSRALPGTTGATFPFWSPDGQSIGFFSDNKLKRIDVASGTALTLAEAANARGATWNADGVILFGPGPRGAIVKVAARGGPVEIVTQPDDKTGPSHHWPQFLPDGRQFLFSSRLGTPETNGVYLGSLGQTPPRRLLAGDSGGRFAAPDRVLTVRQGALQAYKFDPDSGAVEGDSALIAQGFGTASATGVFATSETGVLAYRVDTAQRRQLSWVDRKGTTLGAIGEPQTDFIAAPDLSADERSLLVVTLRSGDNDIWLIELARNLARRITDGPPADAHPMWDPDGRHAVFFSRRFGGGGPARQPIAGGQAQPLFAKGESGVPLSWTADRQYVLLRRQGSNGGLDLVALTTDAASREIVVANSPGDETEGQFSPDGKLVAFVSNESGRAEVLVQSFPDPRSRVQVSTAGGTQVRWSRNSDELFYVAPDGRMMAVPITSSGTTVDVKAPVALFQTHLATGTNVLGIKPQYAVAKDGRFLLNTAVESASAPIVISVNWMKKR